MHRHARRLGIARWISLLASVLALVVPGSAAASSAAAAPGVSWSMGGFDLSNTRFNPSETAISPANASRLTTAWTFTTHGDVSATPAVVGGAVYFPDWGGYLNKVDARTGKLIWSQPISSYDGVTGAISRSSPTVAKGIVYIGDLNGAHLMAVSADTGRLVWISQLDPHPAAVLTQSPVVYGGVVYEGVSSWEEAYAQNNGYPCCTFRGSVTATDAKTGRRLWKQYTVPDNGGVAGGYSGGAVWGGTLAIDHVHGIVYATTGNNYSLPQSVSDCETGGGTAAQCLSPDDHIDAILALNIRTGAIQWATGVKAFDAWNFGCFAGTSPNNCPTNPGGDLDFGDGPHLFTIPGSHGAPRAVVGAGQKSGEYWLVDALTGQVLWSHALAPGGPFGGIMWGTSTDGTRIYVAEDDYKQLPYQLADGSTTTHSSFTALDPATGRVLWQTLDPSTGFAVGALTTAGGVLYATSTSGDLYAMNAATGQIVFDYHAPSASIAGPAVVDGRVYWGDGYTNGGFTGSKTTGTFYAFSLPGCP